MSGEKHIPSQVDLADAIRSLEPTMSKSHRQISHFILDNYDKAAFMTAYKVGEQVGVSESTVVRYAMALGFDGYPQFQEALQQDVRHRMTTLQRMQMTHDQDPASVLRTVVKADMQNIRLTVEEVDGDTFAQVVDAVYAARRIYIMGLRSSAPVAQFLGYYLNFMFDNVTVVTSGVNDVLEQIVHIQQDDLLIGISFPRYSRRTIEGMRYAREKGAALVAITDSKQSPLAAVAGLSLIARSNIASFVDSLVAPLSIVNALIVALGQRHQARTSKQFTQLEDIWSRYHVYVERENE